MTEEKTENSDNPTGNVPQEPILEEPAAASEVPLFLRNNRNIAHGDTQDEMDSAPE